MVRAGDNNELIPIWLRQQIVSIGWPDLENPKHVTTKKTPIKSRFSICRRKATNQI